MDGDFSTTHLPTKARHSVLPLLFLAPVLWGGNFVIGRLISPEFPPVWLNLLRWLVAAVILLPFSLRGCVRNRRALMRDKWSLIGLSGLGIIGFNTTLYGALREVTASQAAIGFAFSPFLILAITALLDGRLPRPGIIIAALIAFSGVLLAYLDAVHDLSVVERARFALLVAPPVVTWSLFCVALGRLRLSSAPGSAFFAQILIGLLLQGAYAFAFGPEFPIDRLGQETVFAIGYLGILASAVAFLGWQIALRHIPPQDAGVFLHLVPLSSLILAWLFLDERLGGSEFMGIALIFAGISLARTGSASRKRRIVTPAPIRARKGA